MKQSSYNRELSIMHLQMIDMLNCIQVFVFNQVSGVNVIDETKTKKVPVLYAGRSRLAKSQMNYQKYFNGPMISLEFTGLTRDSSRIARYHQGLAEYYRNPTIIVQESGFSPDVAYQYDASPLEGYDIRKNPPVPINLSYKVEIITQYQGEMDQIVQNIIANMNPYLAISWKNPRATTESLSWDKEIVTKVYWENEVSQDETTIATDKEEYERMVCSINMRVETWFFPGMGPLPAPYVQGFSEIQTGSNGTYTVANPYTEDVRLSNEFFDGDGLETITVNINPACAVHAGACWRLSTDPVGYYRVPNIGVFAKIPKGAKIEFRKIKDWVEPKSIKAKAGEITVEYTGKCE